MTKKSITRAKFDLDKIRMFTQVQLESMTHNKVPVCYQLGNDVLVGQRKVVKIASGVWEVKSDNQEFFSKKDAIYYCIAMHAKQYRVADEIKVNDRLLAKFEDDAVTYRYRYKKAADASDYWLETVYSSRYTEAVHNIKQIKKHLHKVIGMAKYIKD